MSFKCTKNVRLGSLWRIKNNLSSHYLFDWDGYGYMSEPPVEFYFMQEENALMVVKHKIIKNRHHFWLLGNSHIYEELNIPVGTWDNVFVPLKKRQ